MSRVFKNAIIWVLALAVILCIIAGFTFGLSSVSGVADAMEATLPDNGIINPNLFGDAYYTEMDNPLNLNSGVTSLNQWYAFPSTIITLHDGYVNYLRENNSSGVVLLSQSITGLIPGDTYTVSFYARVNSDISHLSVNISYYYDNSSIVTGLNLPVSSHDFVLYSYTFITNSTKYTGGTVQFDFALGNNYNGDVDFSYIKLEKGANFTGFAIDSNGSYDEGFDDGYDEGYNAGVTDGTQSGYDEGYNVGYNAGVTDGTQSGYDEGYNVGYDEGYNIGISDGLISANQIFNCSAFNIKWDSVNGYAYPSNETASVNLYQNIPFTEMPVGVCVPLSKIAPDYEAGGYLPVDLLPNTGPPTPNPADSIYALRFSTLLDLGQWLLDNPNDYLVSWTVTGAADPACIVFSDLSNLSKFMSGAGENYLIGYDDGYNDGYDDGDGDGYNRGYGVGFNKGQVDASSGNYTFLALIGSVLDAPISAFKGLLDFELLGVNMSSFILAIMSLCVIIVIIRVVLR